MGLSLQDKPQVIKADQVRSISIIVRNKNEDTNQSMYQQAGLQASLQLIVEESQVPSG